MNSAKRSRLLKTLWLRSRQIRNARRQNRIGTRTIKSLPPPSNRNSFLSSKWAASPTLPMSPPSNCNFAIGCDILRSSMPIFSIIIAVYNDWLALNPCLRSIAKQPDVPDFEVIVVDDGSKEPSPEEICQWTRCFPLTIVRRHHIGISAARNQGIRVSKGSLLLFVDADCRLQANCLAALASTIASAPRHNFFQLRLVGNCSSFVGRTEHLRLTSVQDQLLQPDGRMRYLNTAGLAVRRSAVPVEGSLFDPVALRGEDTLLLANLLQREELPYFVPDAIIQHDVPHSLLKCFRKDIRSAFLEGGTMALISSRGVKIRMSNRNRLSIMRSLYRSSKPPSVGRLAFLVVIVRQLLSRITSFVFRATHHRTSSPGKNLASQNGSL
jgi:glycosyltransferase involved in cell wall biosynthesis